ncbi:MAG TPA: sugar phosphate isomerase/epimerase [Chthonomonadales bacterium]|nr:sugar phosphate isomerase/epimerase [Chthonomonadales bacterium]
MRLAFYTYSYTDRLKLPVEECYAHIARTGYTGIDESGTYGPSEDPRSVTFERRMLIRDTARRFGLSIEAVVTHAELTTTLLRQQPLDFMAAVDLAIDLGASLVTFHMGGPAPDGTEGELWRKVVEEIRIAARAAAGRHVSLLVDGIWPGWMVNSPEVLQRLFDDVGEKNFGVNFDPCYLTLMGIDPVAFARRFAARIWHAHLKDFVGRYPQWEHRIPGEGAMDYARVFASLAEVGFTGSMAVECFPNMPFEEACERGYEAMTAVLRKVGV